MYADADMTVHRNVLSWVASKLDEWLLPRDSTDQCVSIGRVTPPITDRHTTEGKCVSRCFSFEDLGFEPFVPRASALISCPISSHISSFVFWQPPFVLTNNATFFFGFGNTAIISCIPLHSVQVLCTFKALHSSGPTSSDWFTSVDGQCTVFLSLINNVLGLCYQWRQQELEPCTSPSQGLLGLLGQHLKPLGHHLRPLGPLGPLGLQQMHQCETTRVAPRPSACNHTGISCPPRPSLQPCTDFTQQVLMITESWLQEGRIRKNQASFWICSF